MMSAPVAVNRDVPIFDPEMVADCFHRLLRLLGIGALMIAAAFAVNWLFATVGGF